MTCTQILHMCVALVASQVAQTQTVSKPPNPKADLSVMASRVLTKVDEARQAGARNRADEALRHVNEALELMSKNPAGKVPIYTELEQASIIGPIVAEQRRESADRPQLTVQSPATEYTSVSVDMTLAKNHLTAARTALQKGNLREADNALAALQNDVVLARVAADAPLLKARQNIHMARVMAQQGRLGDAMIPLRTASEALAEYAKTPAARHADDAIKLRQIIDSSFSTLGQDPSTAASKIDSWWNQMVDWFSQP